MAVIEHQITHYYQPTNQSCGPTATAMILSALGRTDLPQEVMDAVPVLSVGNVQEWGLLGQSLATWLLTQGFEVELHTADFQLLDLEWAKLTRRELLQRIHAAAEVRDVRSLGRDLSRVGLLEYAKFIEAGGELHIHSHVTTKLLVGLLYNGPVFVNVSPNVLNGYGRSLDTGLRDAVRDDLHGGLITHFVVLYGIDERGNFLIADPWTEPGRLTVEPERLLCAITAGQIQCENTIFQARVPTDG